MWVLKNSLPDLKTQSQQSSYYTYLGTPENDPKGLLCQHSDLGTLAQSWATSHQGWATLTTTGHTKDQGLAHTGQ